MRTTDGPAPAALQQLATTLGVATAYTDGHGRRVQVGAETLMAVCNALGARIARPEQAAAELRRLEAEIVSAPPVLVAWDGQLRLIEPRLRREVAAGDGELTLEDGTTVAVGTAGGHDQLPLGRHQLRWEQGADVVSVPVIAAPQTTWRREAGSERRWGVGLQLAAVRSARNPTMGTLADLDELCRWLAAQGADLVTLLPLLPTFNDPPAEPSPYSPVSRLFWSELLLDTATGRQANDEPPPLLDFSQAMADVRARLAEGRQAEVAIGGSLPLGLELTRYAAFRGAQARLGRDWRAWPAAARDGNLAPADIDPTEERFHLAAQLAAREQLAATRRSLDRRGLGTRPRHRRRRPPRRL